MGFLAEKFDTRMNVELYTKAKKEYCIGSIANLFVGWCIWFI
jgi:hypothetical protein